MNYFNTVWEDLINTYFPEFIEFFFPGVAFHINQKGDIQVLDQELEILISNNGNSFCYGDTLLQAQEKGAPKDSSSHTNYEIIHITIQGGRETGFTEKLFRSAYRIYDRFRILPISLVVCTDDDPSFYPSAFELLDAQRYLRLEFNVAKLLYFRERVHDPDCYNNPFTFVTYTQLEVNKLKRKNKYNKKAQLKSYLLSALFSYPLSGDSKSSLIEFLDWILPLSDIQEKQLENSLSKKNLLLYYSLRRKI